MSWSDLSNKERMSLLYKWERGEDVTVDHMKQNTLHRRLRELRQNTGSTLEVDGVTQVPDKATINYNGENSMTITAVGGKIETLDDLLRCCKVDTDIWTVERHIVNAWPVAGRVTEREMEWENGKIVEGYIKEKPEFHREQLIQVKAWLIRKKPIEVHPVVKPVKFILENYPEIEKQYPIPKELNAAIIIPDIHFGFRKDPYSAKLEPFHDRDALDIVYQIMSTYEFSDIVILGDLLDLPEWTERFIRSPDMYMTTQPAIAEASWWLKMFRELQQDAEIEVIEGNHDKRFEDSIIKHVTAGYELRSSDRLHLPPLWSVQSLLSLDDIDANWHAGYPDNSVWISDGIRAEHGTYTGNNAAQRTIDASHESVVFGHIHRHQDIGRTVFSNGNRKQIRAYSPGFLGKTDGSVPGSSSREQWQQGFGIVWYNDDGAYKIEHISINNGTAVFGNTVFKSKFDIGMLEESIPHFNW